MDDDARRSVIENARDILAARGRDEDGVEIEGNDLVVTTREARKRAPLGELAGAWHVLPPNDRDRRLGNILATIGAPPRKPAASPGAQQRLVIGWAIAAVLALMALASVAWARSEAVAAWERRKQRQAATDAPAPDTTERAAERHQTVCTGVRKRVLGGAALGPYESEGWVIEIWLGREDGALTPANAELAKLAAAKAIPQELDPTLAAIKGEIAITSLPLPPGAPATAQAGGAVVEMRGGYAAAYLDPIQRARFVALADRLYDSTGAELGALWGRCGELPWHDLGAWYRGTDRGAAAGTLLFMSGRYSDSGAVPATARDGSANTLGAFVTRARVGVDDRVLAVAVEDVGGKIYATKGVGTTISFPVGGYTLATRSSRELIALLDR